MNDAATAIRLMNAFGDGTGADGMLERPFLMADLLCGAGGTSEGAEVAIRELGRMPELVCVNHWPTAIATHRINHPSARHYVQDIATVRPSEVVPEGYLDLLMASPTCTHHSVARGGKPTSDQQRSDPWHIITWLTELRVARLLIENVWEFTKWGPVDPATMRPIKDREGEYFNAWVSVLRGLGFKVEWRRQNAANYGVPQTRWRMILIARSDGGELLWPGLSHSKGGQGSARWVAARECIDWNIRGKSIFGRPKPLAPATLDRILIGAIKFGWDAGYILRLLPEIERSLLVYIPDAFATRHKRKKGAVRVRKAISRLHRLRTESIQLTPVGAAEPFLVTLRRNADGRSLELPAPTVSANGTHIGLAEPFLLSPQNSGRPRSSDETFSTITTGGSGSAKRRGCARHSLVEPFVLSRHGGGAPRSTSEPTPTQVARHSHVLIAPYYSSGSGKSCSSANEPFPTIPTKARFGMVVPITHGGDTSNRSRDVEVDPFPTVTTANRGELAFVTAQFGERPGQTPRVHDLNGPAPTVSATGHVNLVEGVVVDSENPDCRFDILYRMFVPRELAAASSFPKNYQFTGTVTDQVKQIGNAVPPKMARAHVIALCADAVPERRAAA